MTIRCLLLARVVVLLAVASGACGRDPSSELKGQINTTLMFYGLAVDQDGKPLGGANIEYQVEAYPKDWSFSTRGRPYDVSTASATSNEQGRFQFTVTGCGLRRLRADRDGYRHFFEEDAHDGAPSTYGYQLIAWSTPWYKSDPERPAVYVFLKDGGREVSALPCKGGYDSGGSANWRINKSGWPKEPSLKDVVYAGPKLDAHPHRVEVSKLPVDDRQSSEVVFHGLAIDQNGKPLPGVQFGIEVEQPLPASWRQAGGDRDRLFSPEAVESGPDGRFEVALTGRSIKILYARRNGYFLFGEATLYGSPACNNVIYRLNRLDGQWYKSDPDHPAVYVLVSLGTHEVSALPCRGGYDSSDGKNWVANPPTWPKLPSIKNVYQKGSPR